MPRYAAIEEEIRERIGSGQIRPGDSLPPELHLCRHFGVSRHTMRRALESLQRDGLITRHPGRGTFITRPPQVTQPLSGFYSFVGSLTEQGHAPRSIVLERSVVPASEESREKLGITANEHIIRLIRKRLADDAPLALEIAEIPYRLFPSLATLDLGDGSLYDALERESGLVITGAAETIRPVVLSQKEASLLEVPPGSAAFHVERLTSARDRRVEWRRSLIRGDRYLYSVQLPRRASVDPA